MLSMQDALLCETSCCVRGMDSSNSEEGMSNTIVVLRTDGMSAYLAFDVIAPETAGNDTPTTNDGAQGPGKRVNFHDERDESGRLVFHNIAPESGRPVFHNIAPESTASDTRPVKRIRFDNARSEEEVRSILAKNIQMSEEDPNESEVDLERHQIQQVCFDGLTKILKEENRDVQLMLRRGWVQDFHWRQRALAMLHVDEYAPQALNHHYDVVKKDIEGAGEDSENLSWLVKEQKCFPYF